MATRVLLACSSVEFQVLFVWVPLPELLAQEVQFYPQSRVFLRHHANAVGSFNFFSATFLQGFLPIRSRLYYDSGKEYRKYVPTLTLATHLFRALGRKSTSFYLRVGAVIHARGANLHVGFMV